MSEYFRYFPEVKHTNEVISNIFLRGVIHNLIRGNPRAFLPYVVEDELRPEDVAQHYYGSPKYVWLVYLSNNIIDPYHDWVMTDFNLDRYIAEKYKHCALKWYQENGYPDMTEPTDQEVWAFTQNATIEDNIVEYRNYENEDLAINKDTYNQIPYFLAGNTAPTYLPDYYVNTGYYNTGYTLDDRGRYYIDGKLNVAFRDDGKALQNGDLYLDTYANQYYVWNGEGWSINTVYYFNTEIIQSEWYPLRYYDWEVEQNENKRHIELVDRRYLSRIKDEFKVKINE